MQKIIRFKMYWDLSFNGRNVRKMMKKILLVCIVLLSMIMVIPGVLADTTGTAAVSGNPASTLALTVSGSHSFGDMAVGDNIDSGINTVHVHVVSNAPWTVTVSDAHDGTNQAGTAGKMAEWDGTNWVASGDGGKVLTNALQIGDDVPLVAYFALSGVGHVLYSDIAGVFDYTPKFKQTIAVGDTRVVSGHSYRIVTTFNAALV
jgi:hypothetical protein